MLLSVRTRQAVIFVATVLTIQVGARPAAADQEPARAMIRLQDSQEVSGIVDPRSDSSRVWMRFSSGSTLFLRSFEWNRIGSIQANDQTVPIDRIRDHRTVQLNNPHPNTRLSSAENALGVSTPARTRSTLLQLSDADLARHALHGPSFQGVEFFAFLTDWNDDVTADGLIVCLTPFDDHDSLIPVTGTLRVTLHLLATAEHEGREDPRKSPVNHILARWTRQVFETDMGVLALEYRLPLKNDLVDVISSDGERISCGLSFASAGNGEYSATIHPQQIHVADGLPALGGN